MECLHVLKQKKENYFGKMKLIDIIPLEINKFYRQMMDNYSDSYLRKFRTMLIQIYDFADDNGLVSRNPARRSMSIKSSKANQSNKDAFSEHELAILIKELPDDMTGNSIRLLLGTGMREQELLALTRDDIAPDGSTIRINKAVQTVNGKPKIGPPKSKRSNRSIPVPQDYIPFALYVREYGAQPFLWTLSYKSALCSVGTFRRKYKRVLAEIDGVRLLNPHCCRHTYITRLQAKGVPMETISRLAGHGKIETTDGYLHTSLDTLAKAVEKLNNKKEGDAA